MRLSGRLIKKGVLVQLQDRDLRFTSIHDDARCGVCSQVMIDPVSVCKEGHDFCKKCIETWKKEKPNCPNCRVALLSVFPKSRAVQARINESLVYCDNHKNEWWVERGGSRKRKRECDSEAKLEAESHCEWVGAWEKLPLHLESCCSALIDCPSLCSEMQRSQLAHHICPRRSVRCDVCESDVWFCDMEDHQAKSCPELPFACVCGKYLKNKDRVSHECPDEVIPCPIVGCQIMFARKDKLRHNEKECDSHIELFRARINILENPCYPDYDLKLIAVQSMCLVVGYEGNVHDLVSHIPNDVKVDAKENKETRKGEMLVAAAKSPQELLDVFKLVGMDSGLIVSVPSSLIVPLVCIRTFQVFIMYRDVRDLMDCLTRDLNINCMKSLLGFDSIKNVLVLDVCLSRVNKLSGHKPNNVSPTSYSLIQVQSSRYPSLCYEVGNSSCLKLGAWEHLCNEKFVTEDLDIEIKTLTSTLSVSSGVLRSGHEPFRIVDCHRWSRCDACTEADVLVFSQHELMLLCDCDDAIYHKTQTRRR